MITNMTSNLTNQEKQAFNMGITTVLELFNYEKRK